MLSMEGFVGARALGEESLQMWDLNKRLEAYLARVKFLEEENEVLRAEIRSAKGSLGEDSWRSKYEEELRALRATLDDAFREKCSAELARDNLYEEIQHVKSRCQKEQAAREEAKKQLSMSKKELEEERRAQIWLKERALQLEKEVEALLEVHEEEKAGLDHEIASFSQSLESFRCVPVAFQPVEVEDYSKRLSEIWKGAVETYKTEVSQLESSLCQAKESLWKAVEDNQQSQLQLQHLEKDLAGLRARKDMLEESLSRQWQEQRGEAEKFQLALEALEQEKQALRAQIAQVLEDRQQLMHLKMSLSLEVATYRTLLEAESTRLQMPAGEYKLANGLRDVKLEMSSSKLQPATPEGRRLLSWDHRMSPSVFPKAEAKMQLAKPQSDSLKALTPKSKSPVAREFQKINSVLQSPALKAAGAARDHGAAGRSAPSGALPAAGTEAAAGPCARERPEPPSHAVVVGLGLGEENKHPAEGAAEEETQDPSEEPPGKAPTPQLRYPDRLVTAALEDALKEVREDAQPKEEPMLEAEKATEGYRVGSAPELPSGSAAGHPVEEVDGAEDAKFEALLEERAGEDTHEEPDVESTTQQDGATSHLEVGPSGEQEEENTSDFLVAAQSEIETQEEMRSWEEEGSKEEEMPTLLSPEESREPEVTRDTADGPLGEDTLASSEPDAERWEGSADHPSQAAAAGGGPEEPEQGEDDVEAVSTEALHLSEDEERREPWSPSREDEECDFLEEAKEVREEESLQGEIQATRACPVQSHPVLPGESHLEEDLVEREQESLGHQEMPLCETDPAADEERGEETCPEHEPSSIKESISAEEASSRAEEDTTGEEITDRARDGEGEMGEPGEEALEGEDLRAEGKPLGPEDLRQEEVTLEESTDLQENGFEDDMLEQEDLETLLREEVLGGGDDGNYQKHCPEAWETKGEEDMEGSPGTEDAHVTSQEPAWADDTLTSAEVPESEETEGISPAETEEMGKDDEDYAGSRMSQQEPTPQNEAEQEAEPALGLAREAREGHQDQPAPAPGDEELAVALEASWEAQTAAEDAEGELASEPDGSEKASTGPAAFRQGPGDDADSDACQEEEDARRAEELGQEPGTGKSIQLEDTLPDHTPLHLYEGEMLAATAPSPNPLASEDATEPAPGSEIAPEDEGELEGSHVPTTPLEESHEEEEAGMEPAPAAERAEEEEGYFMVSAPDQEASSSEEAEISEDFEEIKVEATEASRDDLKAPRETSPAPEEEGPFEAFVGEADEGVKVPTEEGEMPKAEDLTAAAEEAVRAAEPGSPPGEGRFAGVADQPDRDAESPGACEGQGPSEGFAAQPDEAAGGAAEPERDASGDAEFPSHDSPREPGTEEPVPGPEDESSAAELIPPGGLQAQTDPGEALVQQPSPAPEDETLDGDGLSPAGEQEQPSDTDPPPPGSSQEADDQGSSDPGHDGFMETSQDNADGLDLPAKMPADVMKDSDILEIVEQALEFNQELMLGARLAEAEQEAPGGTEPARPSRELGEDDSDSSPVSSSEEEPTVQEPPAAEEPATSGIGGAESGELNGLRSQASLEDLAEVPEELPNGVEQEPPGEDAEPPATSAAPPAPDGLGRGEAPAGKTPPLPPPPGKHAGAESAAVLGEQVLRLAPGQPPRRQLPAERESWSSEDD